MIPTHNNSSATSENPNVISGDNPLVNPKNDALGYAPFAENLANSICSMSPPEGFVMAVYGAWGSGKSTLLNFVIHYLEQKQDTERPIIVRFNPWWFSGQEDLTRRFFQQLQADLKKIPSIAKELTEKIAGFADVVSQIPVPEIFGVTVPGFESLQIVSKLGKAITQPQDFHKFKEDIEHILRNQSKKILVVIDDIDRLTAEEIRQLFRMTKAVANFPNVTYLLLFDKDIVIKALKEAQGIPGEEYLEKIVQVPFDLPLPDKSSLRRLLFNQLDIILSGTPQNLFDQTEWGNVYFRGIEHFIKTPRSVVRLINILTLTYPAVKGEVNPVDFIAIESLRVFCPSVYDVIRKNPDQFTGSIPPGQSSDFQLERLRSFHDLWTNSLQDDKKEIIRNLVQQIFPKLQAIWNNSYYDSYSWRRELRICSPEVFPIYFRLAVPEGDFSNTEIQAILTLTDNPQKFGDKLVSCSAFKLGIIKKITQVIIRKYARPKLPQARAKRKATKSSKNREKWRNQRKNAHPLTVERGKNSARNR